MAHEATVNGSDRPVHDLKEHLGGMARDVGRIAELQARLVAADLRQARGALLCTLGCWLTALALVIAILPVAIAGIGLWLADVTRLSVAGGLASAAGAVAVVAVGLAVVGWVQLRKQFALLQESKQELYENVEALRQAFAARLDRATSDV
jgi:hypothetical protein